MKTPHIITCDSFQKAWIEAICFLKNNHWEFSNLVVHIIDTKILDKEIHHKVTQFSKDIKIIPPKDVAYTIFPYNQYKGKGTTPKLYSNYINKLYPWTRRRSHSGWGTYFYRMINYERNGNIINQLDNIISAINNRSTISKAAYTMTIQYPGSESIRKLGSPCLNYLAIQLEPGSPSKIGLLSIYRNHEFLERAYGNYWGLCKLICFLAEETGLIPGSLTCISSHAYVKTKKIVLSELLKDLNSDN